MLNGDDTLLRRMFSNLFGNALKYTPPGGSVDVSLAAVDGEVVLRVADTGPGIPAEDRERVFERFVRLNPARGPAAPDWASRSRAGWPRRTAAACGSSRAGRTAVSSPSACRPESAPATRFSRRVAPSPAAR